MSQMTKEVWLQYVAYAKKAFEQFGENYPELTQLLKNEADSHVDGRVHPKQSEAYKQWVQDVTLVQIVANPVLFCPVERLIEIEPIAIQLKATFYAELHKKFPMFNPDTRPLPPVPERFGGFIDSPIRDRIEGIFGFVASLF